MNKYINTISQLIHAIGLTLFLLFLITAPIILTIAGYSDLHRKYIVGTCLRNSVSTIKITTLHLDGRFDITTSPTSYVDYNSKLVTRSYLDEYNFHIVDCREFI